MSEMEALRDFKFAGRKVAKGDRITATRSEEKTLRAMGWAKPAPVYETRVLVAAPANDQDDDESSRGRKPRTRRQYRRRDMQPEV